MAQELLAVSNRECVDVAVVVLHVISLPLLPEDGGAFAASVTCVLLFPTLPML
jgi:hypothetical protein